MKLPFKLRIVEYAIEANKPISSDDVLAALKDEYMEKQCNINRIESILMTLLGIGIVKVADNRIDETGRLVTNFVITEHGKEFVRMIPCVTE